MTIFNYQRQYLNKQPGALGLMCSAHERQAAGSSVDGGCVCDEQVIDRPTQGHRFLSRQYVQPQWVFDSANFRVRSGCKCPFLSTCVCGVMPLWLHSCQQTDPISVHEVSEACWTTMRRCWQTQQSTHRGPRCRRTCRPLSRWKPQMRRSTCRTMRWSCAACRWGSRALPVPSGRVQHFSSAKGCTFVLPARLQCRALQQLRRSRQFHLQLLSLSSHLRHL